jgi:hypothetical protein
MSPGRYRLPVNVVDHRDHSKPGISVPLDTLIDVVA